MRSTYRDSIGPRFNFRLTPWVKRLLIINAVVFVLMLVFTSSNRALELSVYEYLGFNIAEVYKRPWTIITYMFVHAGFFHVFFNMLMLFFFGPPLEERWGGKEFIKYYLICGVGAALFSLYTLTTGNVLPLVGASGAIYGVMLAYALNWPDSLIWIYAIFPVKAKYMVMILGAVAFFSTFYGASSGVAHYAHLGGLVVGYAYIKQGWRLETRLAGLKKRFQRRKLAVIPGGSERGGQVDKKRSRKVDEEARMHEIVDMLLDKIAASPEGLNALTPEERRFLDEFSRRRRAGNEVRH